MAGIVAFLGINCPTIYCMSVPFLGMMNLPKGRRPPKSFRGEAAEGKATARYLSNNDLHSASSSQLHQTQWVWVHGYLFREFSCELEGDLFSFQF